ncbi:BAF_collapsed_G0012710.mRNA.1.CDS.1 [Saccharomyces cerevisiae]|nr:BAF_collapsed_G0012710.mRNA.1.CDS.1 [Saccharomyces cerevisiae]
MINLEDYWEDETPGPDREPTNELRNEVEETITLMELLKVSELKDICRSVSFPVSGRKAVLQDLIRNFLQNALVVGKSDPYRVQAVKFLIERIRKNEPLPVYKDLWNALRKGTPLSAITVRSMEGPPTVQQQSPSVIRQSPTQRRKTSTTSSTSRAPPPTNPDASSSSSSFAVPTIHFKESPFYKIQRLIPELVMNVEVTGGRGMCSAKFKLSKADYNLLSNPNSKHRLYLFSGMINPLGSRGNEPIQFPFPNELRCNNVQIKDNIRGFKSKPGTAKPADLTPHLKPYTQQNNVELIYAFTTKEYKLFGYIVEMITPEQLLEKVLQHPKIIKQATLLYLKKTLREDEEMGLTTTSTIMSLQCPISYTRMKYPSKSINCKHLQCFDALWFLHSQLQIPTWQCPVFASETTTPVTNRVIPEYLGNSSSYIGKQLPNILGKTPLNVTAVDNSSHLISPDVSVSSPTPRNTASNASSSALSTPPLIRMSSLDPRGSTVPDKTIRPPINSNSYTASISDSFVQPQESSVFPPHEQNTDMSFPSTVNSRFNDPRLNTTRFPDSTLRGATILSNNGLDQRNNSLPTTEVITRNDVGRQNSTPVLPTLPQNVPIRTNSNKSGLPLINNENSVPNPPNTATIPLQKSRLIVNPFIPRRPYSNVLPQKRQLSNTSSTSPIMGTWKTQDYGNKYNSG